MLNALSIFGQAPTIQDDFLHRLDHAAEYTLAVLEKMPSNKLDFRPSPKVRTFAEILEHIASAQLYTASKGIDVKQLKYSGSSNDKAALSAYIKDSYKELRRGIKALEIEDFAKLKSFWDGRATVGRILSFTLDHVTHHRGQATVYLRMNGIKPPDYIGW